MTNTESSDKSELDDHSITHKFATQAVESTLDDHPQSVVEIARQGVIDGIGNALLARNTPLGRSYLDVAMCRSNGYGIIGGGKASPADAAFANSGLINALDWDDTAEGGGHPGSSVIPAALFAAEKTGASIKTFLNAVIIGYELSIRTAIALQPTWERYDLVHGSGTRHAIGAAAAVAAVQRPSIARTQELLGIAAQLAPVPHAANFGWDEGNLTWIKDNNARAAEAAVRAGQFPEEFTGPQEILDGERGFWRMAGSDLCDWDLMAAPVGKPYLLKELAFKPYPCCRWLHAAVEATGEAAAEIGSIDRVTIETSQRVATLFDIEPLSQVNAQFSIHFAVAQAAVGRPKTEWYDSNGPASIPDINVIAEPAEEHTQRFEADRIVSATATAIDANGTEGTASVESPLGTANRPIPMEDSREKLEVGLDQVFEDTNCRVSNIESLLHSNAPISDLLDLLTE